MFLFVTGLLCSLMVIIELNWVQCEPINFAEPVEDIFHFAALHSSSIQPYFAVNRSIRSSKFNGKNAVKIWMLVRHGSRTAKLKETKVFKNMEDGLRAQILDNFANQDDCPLTRDSWENLKKWKWNNKYNKDRLLTETGKVELSEIAGNFIERFPHLFEAPSTKDNFNVICANTSRTINSGHVFFDAAIGRDGRKKVLVVAGEAEERIIKAYKDEEFHTKNKDMEKSDEFLVTQFYKTETFKQVVDDVNNRLLFEDDDLDQRRGRVLNIFDLCRYEATFGVAESVWCSMFTKEELLVLEYSKDLNSYSENGPSGHALNYKVHCPSVLDMMDHLSTSDGPKVTAYFTHSPAILLHLTAMGAYAQGEKLTAQYHDGRQNREWNTSKLSPMAANFVAVLYKDDTLKFFLNEKEAPLGLSDVKSLKKRVKQCKK